MEAMQEYRQYYKSFPQKGLGVSALGQRVIKWEVLEDPIGTVELLWVELCPPERYVEVLTLSTCEPDLIFKKNLCTCNQDKVRSYLIQRAIIQWVVSLERKKFGPRYTETAPYEDTETQGEWRVPVEAEIGVMWQPPGTSKRQRSFPLRVLQKEHGPQTSSL